MNSRHFRRRCAVIAAATTITITTAFAPASSSAADTAGDGTQDRPCFMVRAHWNAALDGPQPTCPTPTWQSRNQVDDEGAAHTSTARVTDFMP